MQQQLIDSFGRQMNYIRLAVTDRCNLRCQYCMPAHGIEIAPREELLTFKEMYRIIRVLTELGVTKIRLTSWVSIKCRFFFLMLIKRMISLKI